MHVHGEKGGGRGHREEGDSGPTDVRAHVRFLAKPNNSNTHLWLCFVVAHESERARVGVRTISKDGEAGIAHGRGGGTAVERSGRSQPQTPMGQ